MPPKQHSFRSILNYPQQLFVIYQQKINLHTQLLALIKSALPAPLAKHACYCVQNGTKLVVFTDAASWSSQLRFFQQPILAKMHAHGHKELTTMNIKVIPQTSFIGLSSKAIIPCRANIQQLGHLAKQQEDHDLRKALSKLTETLHRLSENKN